MTPRRLAYQKIRSDVLKRIETGEWTYGDAIPSERELARTYGVSLMTARHALYDLECDGVVQRRRGVGTFVAPPRIEFNRLSSITEQMHARGLQTHSKVIAFELNANEESAIAALGLESEEKILRFERLRYGADQPFAIETCYLPLARFPRLRREALDRGSLFALLVTDYKTRLSYADEEIDAVAATPRHARLLNVAANAPLLRIRQVIHQADGTPVLYGIGFYRPDRHALVTRRFR